MLKLATGVIVVVTEEVFTGEESVRPGGGVKVTVLVMEPVALPETVPVIVKLMLAPEGRVATVAATLLPDTDTVSGQTAPPEDAVQLACTVVTLLGTRSLKLVPPAALGPLLVRVTV